MKDIVKDIIERIAQLPDESQAAFFAAHNAPDKPSVRATTILEFASAYRKELADLVRSLRPREPESDDTGVEQVIAEALEAAAAAVERGHR